MKKIQLYLSFVAVLFVISAAQAQKLPAIDKSTLDVAYMPHNYPHDGGADLVARVLYSRPAKNGREVFGKLVPYGKVWRVGANETTEIEFFKDVTIAGTPVKAGAYSLFVIPNADSWTIIINTQRHAWGAYSYDEKKDVARVNVTPGTAKEAVENLTILFSGKGMNIYWDNVHVLVPIE